MLHTHKHTLARSPKPPYAKLFRILLHINSAKPSTEYQSQTACESYLHMVAHPSPEAAAVPWTCFATGTRETERPWAECRHDCGVVVADIKQFMASCTCAHTLTHSPAKLSHMSHHLYPGLDTGIDVSTFYPAAGINAVATVSARLPFIIVIRCTPPSDTMSSIPS